MSVEAAMHACPASSGASTPARRSVATHQPTCHGRGYQPIQRDDEDLLTRAIIELASQYGRYGYRRITALLQRAGWHVSKDRVERIWRREGLKVPQKQKPRGRLWLNDGSCVRLRPEHANHVWSYDFVSTKTYDGRTARMLNLIDESTRECLLNTRSTKSRASCFAKFASGVFNADFCQAVQRHALRW